MITIGLLVVAMTVLALMIILDWPQRTAPAPDLPKPPPVSQPIARVAEPEETEDAPPPVAVDPVVAAATLAATKRCHLIVYVSSLKCAPCREVERHYLPLLKQRGVVLQLDVDKHTSICKQYGYYGPVPRVIVFEYRRGRFEPPKVAVGLYVIGRMLQAK